MAENFLNAGKGFIFDLDGVLVDTAKYHYQAWRRLANQLGFDFTLKDNERLKGVSRMRSLEILLSIGGRKVSPDEKEKLAAQKNQWYVELIRNIGPEELLPGAREYLERLKAEGKNLALGSASKNARLILQGTGIAPLFDAIVDGTRVTRAKPDPMIFLLAAEDLRLPPSVCTVFEDAQAGIEAAKAGGMHCVAIGTRRSLRGADAWAANLRDVMKEQFL